MKKVLAGLLALTLAAIPAFSLASYGGSSSIGSSLQRDNCPNGDFSISYYDGTCGDDAEEENASGVTLDGYIYFDDNENGFFDADEEGVQGAIITLKSMTNDILDTDVTSSAGYYAFYNVQPGTYKIHVSIPAQLTLLESVLAFLAPSVHAQSDYEFVVVVDEEDEGTKTVGSTPVVDGAVGSSVNTEEPVEEPTEEEPTEEPTDDDLADGIQEILDFFDEGGEMAAADAIDDEGEDDLAYPEVLPRTGATI